MPYASAGGPVEVTWDSGESRYFKSRHLKLTQTEVHLRGRIRIQWAALDPALAAALVRKLQRQAPVIVVPRTRRAGDPDYVEEVFLPCRLTSSLPTTTALRRKRFDVPTELETLSTYEEVPGLSEPPAPAIEHGERVDLFGGVQGEAAEGVLGQRWRALMPYPGRLLRIETDSDATLRVFDASGAVVREMPVAYGGDYVVLPSNTHEVEVDAEGRRPRVYLDADSFALTLREADGGGYQLRAYGDGRFVLAERVTRTDRSGTTRTLGWRYRLLPEGQGRRRIRRDPENGTTSITHDT